MPASSNYLFQGSANENLLAANRDVILPYYLRINLPFAKTRSNHKRQHYFGLSFSQSKLHYKLEADSIFSPGVGYSFNHIDLVSGAKKCNKKSDSLIRLGGEFGVRANFSNKHNYMIDGESLKIINSEEKFKYLETKFIISLQAELNLKYFYVFARGTGILSNDSKTELGNSQLFLGVSIPIKKVRYY